jgi:hypothetical protein
MIVKTKFYCKSGAQEAAGRGVGIGNLSWVDMFVEGKWYDGEYETWPSESGFRLNGGWRRYWVMKEDGKKMQLSRAKMGSIFELDIAKLRDVKIDNLFN